MIQNLDDKNFQDEVSKPGVAVVDFSAAWCGPCRSLAPHFDALATEYDGRARFYKVDVDEAQETAAANGVMSIPMILFFRDGAVADRHVGVAAKPVLAKKLDAVLG